MLSIDTFEGEDPAVLNRGCGLESNILEKKKKVKEGSAKASDLGGI